MSTSTTPAYPIKRASMTLASADATLSQVEGTTAPLTRPSRDTKMGSMKGKAKKPPAVKASASPGLASHARRKSVDHIPRPRNAFILFRTEMIRNKVVGPKVETDQGNISRIVSQIWNNLPDSDRATWHQKAREELEEHRRKYPEYAYKPQKRNVMKRKTQSDPAVTARCGQAADDILRRFGDNRSDAADAEPALSFTAKTRQERREAAARKRELKAETRRHKQRGVSSSVSSSSAKEESPPLDRVEDSESSLSGFGNFPPAYIGHSSQAIRRHPGLAPVHYAAGLSHQPPPLELLYSHHRRRSISEPPFSHLENGVDMSAGFPDAYNSVLPGPAVFSHLQALENGAIQMSAQAFLQDWHRQMQPQSGESPSTSLQSGTAESAAVRPPLESSTSFRRPPPPPMDLSKTHSSESRALNVPPFGPHGAAQDFTSAHAGQTSYPGRPRTTELATPRTWEFGLATARPAHVAGLEATMLTSPMRDSFADIRRQSALWREEPMQDTNGQRSQLTTPATATFMQSLDLAAHGRQPSWVLTPSTATFGGPHGLVSPTISNIFAQHRPLAAQFAAQHGSTIEELPETLPSSNASAAASPPRRSSGIFDFEPDFLANASSEADDHSGITVHAPEQTDNHMGLPVFLPSPADPSHNSPISGYSSLSDTPAIDTRARFSGLQDEPSPIVAMPSPHEFFNSESPAALDHRHPWRLHHFHSTGNMRHILPHGHDNFSRSLTENCGGDRAAEANSLQPFLQMQHQGLVPANAHTPICQHGLQVAQDQAQSLPEVRPPINWQMYGSQPEHQPIQVNGADSALADAIQCHQLHCSSGEPHMAHAQGMHLQPLNGAHSPMYLHGNSRLSPAMVNNPAFEYPDPLGQRKGALSLHQQHASSVSPIAVCSPLSYFPTESVSYTSPSPSASTTQPLPPNLKATSHVPRNEH